MHVAYVSSCLQLASCFMDRLLGLVLCDRSIPISGGYCGGVPPLPIPNREVKPACADGTAMQCGRVGGRNVGSRLSSFWRREGLENSLQSKASQAPSGRIEKLKD